MTDRDDDLAAQLIDLGGALALDVDLCDDVVAQVSGSRGGDATAAPPSPVRRRALSIAAAIVVALTAALVVPSSRHTLARWFGLDGVDVEVDPHVSLPSDPATPPEGARVVDVDGRRVTVTRLGGHFDDLTISKTVATSDDISEVTVAGRPGLWFSAPHTVLYTGDDGSILSTGVAGATLLVETDVGIVRVEGFDDLDAATTFVGTELADD